MIADHELDPVNVLRRAREDNLVLKVHIEKLRAFAFDRICRCVPPTADVYPGYQCERCTVLAETEPK